MALRTRATCIAAFQALARHGRPGSSIWRWIVVTGRVRLKRVTVGQDTGTVINPDGVRHQIHGNVIQTTEPCAEGARALHRWHGREPANGAVIRS